MLNFELNASLRTEQTLAMDHLMLSTAWLMVNGQCSMVNKLFIHLEFGVAILEEGVDLLSGCDTGIDVGLGSLGTHLLRG